MAIATGREVSPDTPGVTYCWGPWQPAHKSISHHEMNHHLTNHGAGGLLTKTTSACLSRDLGVAYPFLVSSST